MAFLRLLYWFQLSERFGPVVLNITRVFMDICTILSTYLVTLLAFSFGLVFLLSTDVHSIDGKNPTFAAAINKINISEYASNYFDISLVMFWATVAPGPNEDHFPHQGVHGIAAMLLFATYQVLVVIILLNLLIAIMNSTMQALQDKKLLYWKFARSSVWLDYYNDNWGLPPPFNIIILPYIGVLCVYYLILAIYNASLKKDVNGCKVSMKGACKMSKNECDRRRQHVELMQDLISRFMQTKKDDN